MKWKSCLDRRRNLFCGIIVVTTVCLLSAGILISVRPSILSFARISSPETPKPTFLRTASPTTTPTTSPIGPTKNQRRYKPGILNVHEEGIILSEGLTARIIARVGHPVTYEDGSMSETLFHHLPDAGDTFLDERPGHEGNWVYVSNSKADQNHTGGVGAITFSRSGGIIDYRMVLSGSTRNSGGGRTPWNSWISCEEKFGNGTGIGDIYQVDPFGQKEAQVTSIGRGKGIFGSFAYDMNDQTVPRFYASEGRRRGAVRRFTPKITDWEEPWKMLHGRGTLDYLFLIPALEGASFGAFEWTKDLNASKINAGNVYPDCEGIDVDGNQMYLLSHRWSTLWILDLDLQTYTSFSTDDGIFNGHPEQISHYIKDEPNYVNEESAMLYYTGEGGHRAAIYGGSKEGEIYTIIEGPPSPDIASGLAFSPDKLHMIVAYKASGIVLDITRTDGYPFRGRTLDVKYLTRTSDLGSMRLRL